MTTDTCENHGVENCKVCASPELAASSPAEEQDAAPSWQESQILRLPQHLRSVARAHGWDLFEFTLNHALLHETITEWSRQPHGPQSHQRLAQIAQGSNKLFALTMRLSGWTVEQHRACRRDLDGAIALAGAPAPQIILLH